MPLSRLFLIDAHALCYRSFFAIKELRNSQGQATNAVYGFVAMLKKLMRDFQPEFVAVCFDMKGTTLRQKIFADYKIQRPAMSDDLISQIPIIKEIVRAYRYPILEVEGYEADDIIGTIARRVTKKDLEVVIVSDDKDMFQLITKDVKILNSRQDGIIGVAQAEKILGFPPKMIPDYLALAGDQADNIPGVKGIGDVTAKNLLKEFGTLKNVLQHAGDLKPERVRKAVAANTDMARLSYQLALLEDKTPIDVDLESMRVGAADESRLRDIFTNLEFRQFVKDLGSGLDQAIDIVVSQHIATQSQWDSFWAQLPAQKYIAFDILKETEPQKELTRDHKISPSSKLILSGQNKLIFEIQMSQTQWVQNFFADERIVKVAFDFKAHLQRLPDDLAVKGEVFDVKIAGYLTSTMSGNHDLERLAWEFLKKPMSADTDPALKTQLIAQLYPLLSAELQKRDMTSLFTDLEMPLVYVLSEMEREGVSLDLALLSRLSAQTANRIETLIRELHLLAGEEFNLNSPKQLSEILFQKLKLPVIRKTKTGFSTDEGVLLRLADMHALPAKLLEYRQLTKLKSTYIDALPKLIDAKTGKIHATFNQVGAETGRLSSSNPNLQNIPIRTDLGRQIRAAFIPSAENRVILAADYSQIELRILAHLSLDQNLKKAFEKGEDIHAYTAAQIFDVSENEVDSEMRNSAKRVNFGIIYGMSAFGLAKDLQISQAQAQDFIDRYFTRYPGVKTFMDQEIEKCKKLGYVKTILNRRRYIPEINSSNASLRQFAERQAINTPVQGSAADMIKLAMIQVAKDLKKRGLSSKMIITVHDELVFDACLAEEKQLVAVIRECMEQTMKLDVPIVVSLKKGKNWLESEKI